MNRLGFMPERYRAAWTRLNALPQVDEISLMCHFSDADGPRGVAQQMAVFAAASRDLPGERSLSNSAAILRHTVDPAQAALHPEALVVSDWVRPGIVLYGSAPDYPEHSAADWALQPTMTLAAKIIATQALDTRASVGYGSSFVADKPMRIGVVACGYADGYPRICPTGTPVLVDGVPTRTERPGNVSRDTDGDMIADYLDEMRTDIQGLRALAVASAYAEETAQKLGFLSRFLEWRSVPRPWATS